MSKITEIEAALRRLDQAGFERLGNSYLRRKGYDQLNPIGITLGSEKTRAGTPDTMVIRPDGMYVFVEYTTQQTGLAEKFADDVAKCFDEIKTGIPPARVAEIILCHNSSLTPAELHSLQEQCRAHGTLLWPIGPHFLAHDIHDNYPKLARDFLGVEIASGQILRPEEFVTVYSKGSLATPLDTPFYFREDEVTQALAALATSDVVLLTGRTGVGKSRVALECARRYRAAHPEAEVWCVFDRGADLFHELRAQFAAPGHYLLLVDDANRLSKFDYALDLLRDNRDDRTVKLLATVRDYALEPVLTKAHSFGVAEPIILERMTTEQVQTLVRVVYRIEHHAYVERIVEIAEGNPRLALMAAKVANEAQSLSVLADVSSLYHEYFRSIRKDIVELHDPDALRAAGLVAFLRHVDRSNTELMGIIVDTFELDLDNFWATVRRLHALEVFDLYADEVVRVSDQVLATYLFYLAAIHDRSLDLRAMLLKLFPRFQQRFIDSLNPVASAFNHQEIADACRGPVLEALATFRERRDENALLHLLDAFGGLIPAKTLAEVQHRIAVLEPEAMGLPVSFARSNTPAQSPSILSILSHFAYAADPDRAIALELLVDYIDRRPSEASIVVRMLDERFGIRHESYLERFVIQRHTAAVLAAQTDAGRRLLASRLFLAYAQEQLRTEFNRLEAGRGTTLINYRFVVPATDELLAFRRFLWKQISVLFDVAELQQDMSALFANYISQALRRDAAEVLAAEAPVVQALFSARLDTQDFVHVALVRDYTRALDRLGLPVDPGIRDRFAGDTLSFYDLLINDLSDRVDSGWEEADRRHTEQLVSFAQTLDATVLRAVVQRAWSLQKAVTDGFKQYEIGESITRILREFATHNPQEFADILIEQLHAGNPLGLRSRGLIGSLITAVGSGDAYRLLYENDYSERPSWLIAYFSASPPDMISSVLLEELIELYESSPISELPRSLSYLGAYAQAHPQTAIRLIRTIVARSDTEPAAGQILASLFHPDGDLVATAPQLLSNERNLVKRAYFAANAAVAHIDHHAEAFNTLVSIDRGFVREWVAWFYARTPFATRHDDMRDYAALWRRPDAMSVMRDLLEGVRVESRGRMSFDPYLLSFFRITQGTKDGAELSAKQDAFLDEIIENACDDSELMELVFSVVAHLGEERRLGRIAVFLSCSDDFVVFKALPLEPNGWSWSGSAVPMHQRRIDFLQSILPYLDRAALLPHREYIMEQIDSLQHTVERERKRDFMAE